jgi:hypothetical protein
LPRWNEELRLRERRRVFNVQELKRLAAASVSRKLMDIVHFRKLAEGGFNRTFLVSMQDGFEMIARIPYLTTEPRHLLVASEVATMDYLRSYGIPIPRVFGYSATSENTAGTEYIFMEVNAGTNLGDIWFELGETARTTVVRKLVELETQLFSLKFPASGSIYYSRDLDASSDRVEINASLSSSDGHFCIGPDTTLALWFGNRLALDVFRGPCEYYCHTRMKIGRL